MITTYHFIKESTASIVSKSTTDKRDIKSIVQKGQVDTQHERGSTNIGSFRGKVKISTLISHSDMNCFHNESGNSVLPFQHHCPRFTLLAWIQ